ncbi:thioesterase [Sulfolobales archaeon HS-7]|nr:thioesterase [Sulfolobales archaeon HS-7]
MPQYFIYRDYVRIYDTDAQGIVHYAGYYRFFTNAMERFMEQEIRIAYPLVNENLWFVIVESHAEYKKPAKIGDELSVYLSYEVVSEKAIKFKFLLRRDEDEIAQGHLVQVAINPKEWKSIPIPPEVLSRFKGFLQF